jgi:hypothetical protein
MKNTLPLAFIFIVFIAKGQVKICLNAGANYTSVKSALIKEELISIVPGYGGPVESQYPHSNSKQAGFERTFVSKAGFEIGGTLDYSIKGGRFLITTGLSVSLVRFQKKSPKFLYGNGSGDRFVSSFVPRDSYHGTEPYHSPYPQTYYFIYSTGKTGETNILSLRIPVLFGVSLAHNKLLIHAGGTVAYSPYSSEYKVEYDGDDYMEKNPAGINKVVTSATASISYYITKKIGINLTANSSFNSIYKTSESRFSVLALGVSYSLSK